ncbi:hypothetical protein DF122_21495 [Burkholderia pseudomallei]|nr:hypothetical protein DF127_23625 [Burkholderia pseudomallei]RPE20137.1 hypothetical protein DF068_21325 [Burkholderia pseudomallei]RQS89323.1 hypothetical protein DF125_22315 [Burkholderia pseudomallei]RQZ48891.1 hypothetical protein DF060_24755 [Burkholderia pseudomallei]RSK62282.1 hypothetical protein DF122_21495 [Burkholderia pseudomallei]
MRKRYRPRLAGRTQASGRAMRRRPCAMRRAPCAVRHAPCAVRRAQCEWANGRMRRRARIEVHAALADSGAAA